ncbi:RelA/SpoT domain protein [Cuneatibacter sp. NSJ-177]|uniref:GTP pyrophosphokinase n=1 Tax=Cuneatibacter sp. NSJ-177 TaxID=2931401 RepID=UPI001FD595C4|nr:RelA/SpoT domain protein [Cuneatibacter sp. NSJ-177]MCJ7836771.1 RelA/SpoT domain protein [Cuneatibacter sp. NSJ-177]
MDLTFEEFYAEQLPAMKSAEEMLLRIADQYVLAAEDGRMIQPVIYCTSRIKSPDSALQKLERCGWEKNRSAALTELYDIIGLRIVCSFIDDVYQVSDWLKARPEFEVDEIKDYIAFPKPNGYRSLHLKVRIREGPSSGFRAEIQIRTIAIDFWATLEHQLKYKQEIEHETLIRKELKRCADEIASVDLSMQTIRDLICDGWSMDRKDGNPRDSLLRV